MTPLYKLMFIDTRGMGALEYEPAAEELTYTRGIDINALYDLSLRILEDRKMIPANEHLTMQIASQIYGIQTAANGLCFTHKEQPV